MINRGWGSEAMKHTPCTITSNIVFIEIFPGLLLSLFLRYKRHQQVQQQSVPPAVSCYQPSDSLQYWVHTAGILQCSSHPAALQSQVSAELEVVSPPPPSLSIIFLVCRRGGCARRCTALLCSAVLCSVQNVTAARQQR